MLLLHPKGVTHSPQLWIFMLPSACSVSLGGFGRGAIHSASDTGQGWAQLAHGSVLGVHLCPHWVAKNRWMVQEERWQRNAPEGVWGLCALELDPVGAGRPHCSQPSGHSEWQFWSSSMCTFPGRAGQNCGRGVVDKTWKGERQKNWEERARTRLFPEPHDKEPALFPCIRWHLHTLCLHSCDVCHHRVLPSVQPSHQKSVWGPWAQAIPVSVHGHSSEGRKKT